jgi:hypothetical protein
MVGAVCVRARPAPDRRRRTARRNRLPTGRPGSTGHRGDRDSSSRRRHWLRPSARWSRIGGGVLSWTDLTISGESVRTKAGVALFTAETLHRYAAKFATGADARAASPIFSDLAGLPPLLVQVGGDEVLLDDAGRLAHRAAADGVDVTLEVGAGLPHVYQTNAGQLDDADEALDRAAAFLGARLRMEPATLA